MKAVLEFNLNEVEDVKSHMLCVKAVDMCIVLFQIKYNLLKKLEEVQELDSTGAIDILDILRQELNALYEDYGITEQLLN